ncbi:MAG: nidogen-like domain-containing protein [Reyranellaceae bacterium]
MAASIVNGLGGTSGFGENALPRGDDNSSGAIDITSIFGNQGLNLFGHSYTSLYLNNNGTVSFDGPLSAFNPTAITAATAAIIAPFWGDVDTRGGAVTATPGGTSTGSNRVYYDLDPENGVLTVTWDDVAYYSRHADKLNAFQLQLISLGNGDFDIVFRYEGVNWTTGDDSGGSGGLGGNVAVAGYSAGDGLHFSQLPQSGNQAAMLSLPTAVGNTGLPGVFAFEVHSSNSVAEVSVAAASADKAEGDGGQTLFTFNVTFDRAVLVAQTVNWSVAGSGAHAADAADFGGMLPTGTLTFAAGETSKLVTVLVTADSVVEADEGFTVTLSAPTGGATLGTSTAVGTIRDDDASIVTLAHDDAYVALKASVLHIADSNGVLFNDVAGSPATATLLTPPTHGTVVLSANGGFDYTPGAGGTGIDHFTYRTTGANGTDDAEVAIYVTPVNIGAATTLSLVALTPEQQISATYAAFLGRGADAAGFQFWVGEFQHGLPTQGSSVLLGIANAFAISKEAKGLYPLLADPLQANDAQVGAFIDSVYNNLFNRSSDAAGLAYWTGQAKAMLAAGQVVGSVLVDIMSGAQDTAGGKDITTLMGKVAVGLEYVGQQEEQHTAWAGPSDAAAATTLLRGVGSDPASVLAGIKNADELIASHP